MQKHLYLQITQIFLLTCLSCYAQEPAQSTHLATFVRLDAKPIDAIIATALQTHIPIGIVMGEHQQSLCESKHAFEIQADTALDALVKSLKGTGYSVRDEQGVLVVAASDLTAFQQQLLRHRFDSFSVQAGTTMAGLGAQLTGALWLGTGLVGGVGGSTLYSLSASKYKLDDMGASTTEEIANRIVSLPPKGMWMFKAIDTSGSGKPMPVVKTWSYVDDREDIQEISCEI